MQVFTCDRIIGRNAGQYSSSREKDEEYSHGIKENILNQNNWSQILLHIVLQRFIEDCHEDIEGVNPDDSLNILNLVKEKLIFTF